MAVGNGVIPRSETHTNALARQTRQLKVGAQLVSDETLKRLANPPSNVVSKSDNVGGAQPKSLNRSGKWKCVVAIPVPSANMNGGLKARVVGILGRSTKLDYELCLAIV